ncbi:YbfB/YjiJ family MFS transporter [Extensimonas perlucida]|uniref:YbfB/YjiJ family MFS transporter n=1 Tax=Extensimonas perlucida TaxID=2590786 RepID=UPI001FE27BB5|nr:YbfB/YjiJ family MFS transporter [Extensimonas perlucida]
MQTENLSFRTALWLAVALSLGAAVSLGITRFAYALMLPPMRADLGWSYTLAGAMNTANALGYLLGALATPLLLRRLAPGTLLLAGSVLATLFMALSGFFVTPAPLLAQRLLAGVASALVFVTGGLLAARLGSLHARRSGLLLGLYYGGAGWGISASALLVPAVLARAPGPHAWAWAWWALAGVCALATALLRWPARVLRGLDAAPAAATGASAPQPQQMPAGAHEPASAASASPQEPVSAAAASPQEPASATAAGGASDAAPLRWRALAPALAGYTLFGVGYIGYMTFVVALLREQGASGAAVTVFYALLGLAVLLSSRIWAGLLDRAKGGGALALLNALLGVATVLPALTAWWPVVLASGLLFGGVFLSVVASTTALVRHNLPPTRWALGISAFTIVFAAGQIVGPTVVGWIADGPGGLARGLVFSACALWLGALLAARQKPLGQVPA